MKHYLLFDLGGSAVKYALANQKYELLETGSFPSPTTSFSTSDIPLLQEHYNDYPELHKVFNQITDQMVAVQKQFLAYNLTGVAISAPGLVDNNKGVISGLSALPYIHYFNIKEAWQEAFGLPVAMANDGNCAALAELEGGVASHLNDALLVVCGTGIGGAVIKDRKLHLGKNLCAGEFGFMVLNDEGLSWSRLATTTRLSEAVAKAKNLPTEEMNGKRVYELADQGDNDAKQALDRFYYYMAKGLYNLQSVYDPDIIMIGGAISTNTRFMADLQKYLDNLTHLFEGGGVLKLNVKACHWGNNANLIGALVYLQASLHP